MPPDSVSPVTYAGQNAPTDESSAFAEALRSLNNNDAENKDTDSWFPHRAVAEDEIPAGSPGALPRNIPAYHGGTYAAPGNIHFNQEVNAAIIRASAETGVSVDVLRTFAKIESSGNPSAVTGSYQGLFQLSLSEFNKYGGGNIFSAQDNAMAGARKLAAESRAFEQRVGHPPSAAELYLIHQQGFGGALAHLSNPDAPAWQNMASTAEGRQKGSDWAKLAIWGNVPSDLKARYGSVEAMTSRDFIEMWAAKTGSEPVMAPTAVAAATTTTPVAPQAETPRPPTPDAVSLGGSRIALRTVGTEPVVAPEPVAIAPPRRLAALKAMPQSDTKPPATVAAAVITPKPRVDHAQLTATG